MDPIVVGLEILTVLFASGAIIFSLRENKTKKKLDIQKVELTRRLYEVSTLNGISEVIGYSLSINKVIERIIASIKILFPTSVISYILRADDLVEFSIYPLKTSGKLYVQTIKEISMQAGYALDSRLKGLPVNDHVQGAISSSPDAPQSYFNVPLIVNKKFVGLISVSSNLKKQYQEEDMQILYNVVRHATGMIEKLERIVETEKGRLNSLLSSISTGAIMLSIEDNVLELSAINTSAKDFLNLTGDPDTYKVLTSFGTEVSLQAHIKKVLDDKKTSIIESVKVRDNYFKIFVNPVFLYGTGRIIGVSITMQNMTLEKQIQEIRETFTHMVVHELRAPLTSMKGASELLLSGKLKDEEKQKMLQLVKDSTVRMLSEISDLLDASKIEAGRFEIGKEDADINKVISERVQIFIPMASQKSIELATSLASNIFLFEFDKERIGQVMNNLLSNSIKYTHQGGKIIVTSVVEGNFCKVSVTDNGIGIAKEKQAKLFNRYSQIGQGGFKTGTTGLGLYISKSIIDSHSGKIGLESDEQSGTTVWFMLPITKSPQGEQQRSASPSMPQQVVVN